MNKVTLPTTMMILATLVFLAGLYMPTYIQIPTMVVALAYGLYSLWRRRER
jgi:hypothetical protein